jgi:FemAB-related protein (PEP-CTERM system-associated)
MPFLDAGGPCGESEAAREALLSRVIEEARKAGARSVEIRSTERLSLPVEPVTEKVRMVLPLSDPDGTWRGLDSKVRNQVRKAERAGLSVEFGGAEKLDHFYEPFAVNMRDLGSPVHSRGFFRAMIDAFGDAIRLGVVYRAARPVGGLVAVALKDTLAVPWASSLREYRALCPNMLLYWETIRQACREGFQRFDFGRSSRHSGTYAFKRQWGAREEPLYWYTLSMRSEGQGDHRPSDGWRKAVLARAWSRLPIALTKRLGPRLRGQLTQ